MFWYQQVLSLEVLARWWETAVRSENGPHVSDERLQQIAHVGKPAYLQMVARLHRGMIPGWDERSDEAQRELEIEWRHDSKGKGVLTKDDLYNALFELADVCAPACCCARGRGGDLASALCKRAARVSEHANRFCPRPHRLLPSTCAVPLTRISLPRATAHRYGRAA